MSKEPSDGQVVFLAVLAMIGLILLGIGLACFGIFALYASITAFVAGNIWAGILWGLYPWFVLSGGAKAVADGFNKERGK